MHFALNSRVVAGCIAISFMAISCIALHAHECYAQNTGDAVAVSAQEQFELFDGESLKGWHANPEDALSDWTVEDGVIVGVGSVDRLSYLVWDDVELTDFELRLKYRLPGEGNTGIEIRSQDDPSGKRPFQGYHADLGHVGIGDHILGAWDFHFATRREYPCPRGTRLVIGPDGDTESTKIENPIPLGEIKQGDWNEVKIVAKGRHFQFYINGKMASEFVDNATEGRLDTGAIALQIHDKGMRVEFKDIYLVK